MALVLPPDIVETGDVKEFEGARDPEVIEVVWDCVLGDIFELEGWLANENPGPDVVVTELDVLWREYVEDDETLVEPEPLEIGSWADVLEKPELVVPLVDAEFVEGPLEKVPEETDCPVPVKDALEEALEEAMLSVRVPPLLEDDRDVVPEDDPLEAATEDVLSETEELELDDGPRDLELLPCMLLICKYDPVDAALPDCEVALCMREVCP